MAMLFSGIGAAALLTIAPGAATAAGDRGLGWKKINELTTSAIVDTSKAAMSANLGERGALIGRIAPDACFHLLRLNFSGTCGLPSLSVWRLTMCKRSPCFTSQSRRSRTYACQC